MDLWTKLITHPWDGLSMSNKNYAMIRNILSLELRPSPSDAITPVTPSLHSENPENNVTYLWRHYDVNNVRLDREPKTCRFFRFLLVLLSKISDTIDVGRGGPKKIEFGNWPIFSTEFVNIAHILADIGNRNIVLLWQISNGYFEIIGTEIGNHTPLEIPLRAWYK